jgi:hypothetical protein
MPEAPRSNRPTPRTTAAVEAELKRRIRAELTQARADAEGELDDATLATIIAGAIAAAMSWHLESPDHTRNSTLSSRTWRPAGGPRGGGARPPRDFEERAASDDRSADRPRFGDRPRQFDDRPRQFGDRPRQFGADRPRGPFQERGPRDYDERDAPPRREPRDFDERGDFPPRGPQGRPPFNPRGGSRPSGGGGFGPRRGGSGRPPSNRGGGGGFGSRRPPPRGR